MTRYRYVRGTSRTLSAPAPAPATAVAKYTEEDLETILKICMDAEGSQEEGPQQPPLKARFHELYFGKFHMECYHFCRQSEDHFDTAGATGPNRTPFAASFLRGRISFRWQQHKRRQEGVAPLPWSEFKTFLRKNLGDSQRS